jgi:hypothetical protein
VNTINRTEMSVNTLLGNAIQNNVCVCVRGACTCTCNNYHIKRAQMAIAQI